MALLRCARHDYYLSFFSKKNRIGDDAVFFAQNSWVSISITDILSYMKNT